MESRQSVAGVARRSDGCVLIMHRLPGGSSGSLWEFPGGKVEPSEGQEEALAREWLEEIGLQVRVGQKIAQGSFKHCGEKFSLTAYNVLLPGDGAVPELLEHDDYRWVRPEDLDAFDFVDSDRIVVRALTD